MDKAQWQRTARLHARTRLYQTRLAEARDIVREALTVMKAPYIAFSGGKDSLVAAHLVWEQAPATMGVYFDADCAYPETYEFIDRSVADGRPVRKYACEPMLETFRRHGGPLADGIGDITMYSTVWEPLARLQQEMILDGAFVGLREDESRGRKMLSRTRTQLFYSQKSAQWEALPMAHFSYWDVWAFIHSSNLDYNRIYDKMLDMPEREQRVSYWAGETNSNFGRWVFLRRHYPALWNKFASLFPEVLQET